MDNKYGEPWASVDGNLVAIPTDDSGSLMVFGYALRDRVCACVNALAGVEDPEAQVEKWKQLQEDETKDHLPLRGPRPEGRR